MSNIDDDQSDMLREDLRRDDLIQSYREENVLLRARASKYRDLLTNAIDNLTASHLGSPYDECTICLDLAARIRAALENP